MRTCRSAFRKTQAGSNITIIGLSSDGVKKMKDLELLCLVF